jgi:hypothetical protein
MTDRKKPGLAFWATVALAVVLAYPLSFGPACWLADNGLTSMRTTACIYKPILFAASRGPRPIRGVLRSYAQWPAGPLDPTYMGPRQDPIMAGVLERIREAD